MGERYNINEVSLTRVKNKNEQRVISLLPKVLEEFPDYYPEQLDLEDIYALTLNSLPPRYVQLGSIVIREEVTKELIMDKLRDSIGKVRNNPNY